MALVSDIITESFVDLAVIRPGETITSDMLANAFLVLKQMYSGWSDDQTLAYLVVHQNFTVVAGTAAYTLGLAGTLASSARPIRVTSWQSQSGQFSTGGLAMPMDEFRAKTVNATAKTSVLPEMVGVDNGFSVIEVELFPTPATSPGTLRLDYWSPLVAFSATSDSLSLPDGYEAALHFNLAVALAPQYAREGGIRPELAANAKNALDFIRAKNAAILGLGGQQAA